MANPATGQGQSGSGNSDDTRSLFLAKLGQASGQTNQPGFFSSDPYNSYNVYLGGTYGKPVGVMGGYTGGGLTAAPGVSLGDSKTQYSTTPYGQAVLAPTQWGSDQLREFVNKGIVSKIPGFDVGMGMPQIQSAWQSLVQSSIMFNQGLKPGQAPWTPMDVMDTWSNQKGKFGTQRQGDWIFDVATGERIKYVGKTSRTTTSKSVDLSSPEQAQALVTQVLRETIGRAPTPAEVAKFKASINGYEQANPTVTKTTEQLTPDLSAGTVNVTSQSSTTSGGVSDAVRAALVSDPTHDTKEYGKYQSATTYWDAMMQMIGGGG